MTTAWWLLIVCVVLVAGTLFGWCLRVALTRAQEGVREVEAQRRATALARGAANTGFLASWD